jgi:hypothetical protein
MAPFISSAPIITEFGSFSFSAEKCAGAVPLAASDMSSFPIRFQNEPRFAE